MDDQIVVWLGLIGIGVVSLIILLISSFGSISVQEIGLDYSSLFKSIDLKAYPPGLYYIGITHSFIKFPATIQTIEFAINKRQEDGAIRSRTSDGLEVILEISFQFRLMPDKLYNLYMKFGHSYLHVFKLIAIDTLTDMTTQFTAYQFFYDRQNIGDTMKAKLGEIFMRESFSTIEFFQLRTVDLPDPFETSIQDTEVAKQDIEKAKAERAKNLIEWQTKVKEAEFQKDVMLNLAKGDAQAILQQNIAEVQNINITQTLKATAYAALKAELGFSNLELLNYIKAKLINDYTNSEHMVLSFPQLNLTST